MMAHLTAIDNEIPAQEDGDLVGNRGIERLEPPVLRGDREQRALGGHALETLADLGQ